MGEDLRLVSDHGKDLDVKMTVSDKLVDNECKDDLLDVSQQLSHWPIAKENVSKLEISYVGHLITGTFNDRYSLDIVVNCYLFNNKIFFRDVGFGVEPRDNCELSDRDTRELDAANPAHFDNTANEYDFYERSLGRMNEECLDGID